MFLLNISMRDLYGNADFSIEAPSLVPSCIRDAIERNADKWKSILSMQGAGHVTVMCKGVMVAVGAIVWFGLGGGHAIELESTI